jgi:hypothetical protein
MVDIGAVAFVSAIVIRRGPNTINAKEPYEKDTRGKKKGLTFMKRQRGREVTRRDATRPGTLHA